MNNTARIACFVTLNGVKIEGLYIHFFHVEMETFVMVYSLGVIGVIGLYAWITWVCIRDSHHSLILASRQYLHALKQQQIDNDNRFLQALERG